MLSHQAFSQLLEKASYAPKISETPHLLQALLAKHKLSEDDYSRILRILDRPPTMAELGVFSALWSEHCSYRSSKVHLRRLPSKGKEVVVGPGENAGIVRLWRNLCLAFKMESHNHPSFIDPFQGAATGVGGILRDVFCMGARPFALLDALRFGERRHPKTPWLMEGVVKGIGDYGNCMGIPTVGGSLAFDSSYNGNILVNAMAIGLIKEEAIFKGQAAGEGNYIVYVGSPTGRDGIHGATMASDSFASADDQSREAVQVGDPFWGKLLLEATLEVLAEKLVVGIQDMGAAGLTSSLFEMAERGQSGLIIDLARVPVRSQGMTAYELLLSESQERMAMVVEARHLSRLEAIFDKWQLAYGVIGVVTNSGRVQAVYNQRLEVDIPQKPLSALTPILDRPQKARPQRPAGDFDDRCRQAFVLIAADELLTKLLYLKPGKAWIYRQYDHHIGRKTCLGPESQGAAVLWIPSEELSEEEAKEFPPHLGIAVAASACERWCRLSPFEGAAQSVLKAARPLFAVGASPLAITDCLNYGSPKEPEVMWELASSIDGIAEACQKLGLAVISGNVSLYNETDGQGIAPTPMIGMVGRLDDIRKSLPAVPSKEGFIYVLSPLAGHASFAASLLAEALGLPLDCGDVPPLLWEAELEAAAFIQKAMAADSLLAVRDSGQGGLGGCLLQMALSSGLGLKLERPWQAELFAEKSATYVLVSPYQEKTFLASVSPLEHCQLSLWGQFTTKGEIQIDGRTFERKALEKAYFSLESW